MVDLKSTKEEKSHQEKPAKEAQKPAEKAAKELDKSK